MNKIDPRSYPPVIKECWSVHQALRTLGFSANDIYVALAKDARRPEVEVALFVVLKAQGKEFIVTLDGYSSEEEAEKMICKWTEFVTNVKNDMFEVDDLDDVYESSGVMRNKIHFIMALRTKGIYPKLEWS